MQHANQVEAQKAAKKTGMPKENVKEVVFKGESESKRETKKPGKDDDPAKMEDGRKEAKVVVLSHIIVDCSSFVYVDLMGLETIHQAYKEFSGVSIKVYFADCSGQLK